MLEAYRRIGGGPGSPQAREAFHTSFQAVAQTKVAGLSDW